MILTKEEATDIYNETSDEFAVIQRYSKTNKYYTVGGILFRDKNSRTHLLKYKKLSCSFINSDVTFDLNCKSILQTIADEVDVYEVYS